MTEAEWNDCADPQRLLDFLRGRTSERKLRLFAVACCHRIWHLITDERSRKAVDVAERYADGAATEQERVIAKKNASSASASADFTSRTISAAAESTGGDVGDEAEAAASAALAAQGAEAAVSASVKRGARHAADHSAWAAAQAPGSETSLDAERAAQARLLGDVVGPFLFRPRACVPSRRPREVIRLAQAIYDERAFDRLPVLADALEEAGCTNAEILNHLRGPGSHTRGCFILDLLLGKE